MASQNFTVIAVMALWMFLLYYATIPKMNGGPFINLPSDESTEKTVNITHGIVFVALLLLTGKFVMSLAKGGGGGGYYSIPKGY